MNSNIMNVALILGTLFALNKFLSPDIKEGYGTLPPQTLKMQRVYGQPGQHSSAMFEVPGNYQASLPLRTARSRGRGFNSWFCA